MKTSGPHNRFAMSSRDTSSCRRSSSSSEEIHRLPRESNAVAPAPQLVGGHVDLELSEAVRHAGGPCSSLGQVIACHKEMLLV